MSKPRTVLDFEEGDFYQPVEFTVTPEFNEIGTVSEMDEQGPIVTVDGQVRPDLRGFDHFS